MTHFLLSSGRQLKKVEWYLGTAQLVNHYGVSNVLRKNRSGSKNESDGASRSFRVLEAAVAAGVSGFDTARRYGQAEVILGEFARAHGVHMPVITKILDRPTGAYSDANLVDVALAEINDACRRLAPLSVEAVLFHDAEIAVHRSAAVRMLVERACVEMPGVDIGNSIYEERQAREDAWLGTAPVYQVPGNALDQRFLGLRWDNKQKVMVRSVFLQGLLLNPKAQLPQTIKHHAGVLAKYHAIVAEYKLGPIMTAIAVVHSCLSSAQLVIGAEIEAQVWEIARSIRESPSVAEEVICEIDTLRSSVPLELIDPRCW